MHAEFWSVCLEERGCLGDQGVDLNSSVFNVVLNAGDEEWLRLPLHERKQTPRPLFVQALELEEALLRAVLRSGTCAK